MKEIELIETIKEEVIIKSTDKVIGKILLNQETNVMTVISNHFNLADIQNALFKLTSKSHDLIPMIIAGDHVFPGDWTIVIRSKE